MKVAICIPSGDMLHADFAIALAALVRTTRVERLSLFNQRMSLLPEGRNELVRQALADGADWLFWLDSDMLFPSTALDRLLAHHQHIVGATYLRRTPPHRLLGAPHPGGWGAFGLTEMAVMPFGCMLVRRQVFEDLRTPWFRLDYEGAQPVGEDVGFCRRAIDAGYQIYNDDTLTLELGHVGRTVFAVPAAGVASCHEGPQAAADDAGPPACGGLEAAA
jgi:hypothetical protein